MARGQNINSMVFNKPLLVTLDSLQPITDYLSNPERVANLKLEKPKEEVLLGLSDFGNEKEYQNYTLSKIGVNPETMVGVLDVSGALVYRAGEMNANCIELTSYEGLKAQAEKQIEAGAKTIVLKIDSGGGMAMGMFSAANHIKKIATQNGVKTISYIDGLAASAALGLAVLSDEVIAHPQSQVGSVGVVVSLYNDSQMLSNMGIKRQFVFAGDNKIPFDNSTGEFTDKFISDLQKSVNKTYKTFVSHVATHRNISEESVRETNASVYDVDDALAVGFIDKVMELEDFELAYGLKTPNNKTTGLKQYAGIPVENKQLKHNKETQTMSEQNVQEQVASVEELTAQLATAKTDKKSLETQVAKLQGDLSKVQSDLSASVLAKEHAEAELTKFKADAAHNARVGQLATVFGADSEKPQMYATMFASLDAEAFGKVVSDFQASVKTQEQSMEEVGHSASASAIAETPEEMLLKQAQARKAKQKA